MATLPLEFESADAAFRREPPDDGLTPEQAFDRSWALGVIEEALKELQGEYEASGRGQLFAALAPTIWGGGAPLPLAAQARALGLQEGALKVALHRLRKRLRERLCANVAATIGEHDDLADEMRHLMTSLAGKSPAL